MLFVKTKDLVWAYVDDMPPAFFSPYMGRVERLWNGNTFSPAALSIVQARFVGLIHFTAGLIFTYAAFVIGATS